MQESQFGNWQGPAACTSCLTAGAPSRELTLVCCQVLAKMHWQPAGGYPWSLLYDTSACQQASWAPQLSITATLSRHCHDIGHFYER